MPLYDSNGFSVQQCFHSLPLGSNSNCYVGDCAPALNVSISECAILTIHQNKAMNDSEPIPVSKFVFGSIHHGTFCLPCTGDIHPDVTQYPADQPIDNRSAVVATALETGSAAGIVNVVTSEFSDALFEVQVQDFAVGPLGRQTYPWADVCGLSGGSVSYGCASPTYGAWTSWSACAPGDSARRRTFQPITDTLVNAPFVERTAANETQICHCCASDTNVAYYWNLTHGAPGSFADFEHPFYNEVLVEDCDEVKVGGSVHFLDIAFMQCQSVVN